MNTHNYRHSLTLTQLFSRHLMHAAMPGLMPPGPASAMRRPFGPQEPGKLPGVLLERLLRQDGRRRSNGPGQPIATFNAPQPAAARAAHPSLVERACLDALPPVRGVYVLRGEDGAPLYVGRSVNLRSRVLAHLHGHEETPLARQTRRVEFRRCAGELGAALLENRLVRELRPAHNRQPRRARLFTLRLDADGRPRAVRVAERDFNRAERLFGLFASERAAQEALRKLVEQHQLCPIATGLERGRGQGQACFARQIRRCRGACTGEEPREQHQRRLMRALEALRILPWPYEGPMGILEQGDGWRQLHVLDRWRYLGTLDRQQRQLPPSSAAQRQGFDLDSYKIVIKPFLLGQLDLRALPDLTPAAPA